MGFKFDFDAPGVSFWGYRPEVGVKFRGTFQNLGFVLVGSVLKWGFDLEAHSRSRYQIRWALQNWGSEKVGTEKRSKTFTVVREKQKKISMAPANAPCNFRD
jgi:hypothetical protein